MLLKGKHIGFGLTGSHCTYEEVMPEIENLVSLGAKVTPFVSYTVQTTDSKFGKSDDWIKKIKDITSEPLVDTIVKAEPFGPKTPLDCMVIAPLTGNSTSKLANALTDTPVLMGAKATMRTGGPIVLAVSTNDALGLNGVNIMTLMAAKNIYFVPLGQDHPFKKPNSLVADMTKIPETVKNALEGKQVQPVFIERYKN
ncbi:dipicolinate synthase subunit B [Salipaludibacillus agaradhaerens]|uniref:dipicolinate synthase subunit B n=1 Tax=Salipaludibacillus agaradhaerens TaxID=76935 RepID=UPI0021515567|nr:dipicolinate synthase subunit B [Salipaludibacillus agaradhaerens]MCR6107015.1 dipicolinate synthase subunit B [Salipaludibacillus agaradhaerens]MCR6119046.1 dipicolinate synthase subunit B [Salipaludibacillus agaradhaerens]UJW58099.1 dipicolinate synthase subunit B [Bacillus sp. A116_S68]